MRVASSTLSTNVLSQLSSLQQELSKRQTQLASGQKIETASDDPVIAAQITQINQQLNTLDSYHNNATAAKNALSYSDSTMGSYQNVLYSVKNLLVQAGNSSILSASDRQAIATQLRSYLTEIAGIANTQGGQGEYIYAGYQAQTQPFTQDSTGRYQFNGDQGQRFIQVGPNTQIGMNDSGKDIFVTVPATTGSWVTKATTTNTGSGTISLGTVTDSATWAASVAANSSYTLTMNAAPANTYSVVDNTGTPVAGLTNVAYVAGQTVTVQGVSFTLSGTPNAGDTFTLGPANTQDVFAIISNAANALMTANNNTDMQYMLSVSLGNLNNAVSTSSNARADVGSRLNVVNNQDNTNSSLISTSQQTLSKLNAIDYSEVITEVSQLNLAIQAAQGVFTKVKSLNLFNFMSGISG